MGGSKFWKFISTHSPVEASKTNGDCEKYKINLALLGKVLLTFCSPRAASKNVQIILHLQVILKKPGKSKTLIKLS